MGGDQWLCTLSYTPPALLAPCLPLHVIRPFPYTLLGTGELCRCGCKHCVISCYDSHWCRSSNLCFSHLGGYVDVATYIAHSLLMLAVHVWREWLCTSSYTPLVTCSFSHIGVPTLMHFFVHLTVILSYAPWSSCRPCITMADCSQLSQCICGMWLSTSLSGQHLLFHPDCIHMLAYNTCVPVVTLIASLQLLDVVTIPPSMPISLDHLSWKARPGPIFCPFSCILSRFVNGYVQHTQ